MRKEIDGVPEGSEHCLTSETDDTPIQEEPAKEVYLKDPNGPLESPAKEFVPGPFYASVEEVVEELACDEDAGQANESLVNQFKVDRRDFLRLFSASSLVATAACVRRPEEKLFPYVDHPIDQPIGVAVHYATSCGECSSGCGIQVKTKSGYPIKIEGLADHPVNRGATCALGQSSLQALYHPERRTAPISRRGHRMGETSWKEAFEILASRVGKAEKIGILTRANQGHERDFYEDFLKKVGGSADDLFMVETQALKSSLAEAHQILMNRRVVPTYFLSKADVIVGLGADFLDIGTAMTFYAKEFAAAHQVRSDGSMAEFIQFESQLSMTGGAADHRVVVPTEHEIAVGLALLQKLAAQGGLGKAIQDEIKRLIKPYKRYVDAMVADQGKELDKVLAKVQQSESSVFMAGNSATSSQATALQYITALLNLAVGAYDNGLVDVGAHASQEDSTSISHFLEKAENYDLLMVIDLDPVFYFSDAFGVTEALKKIDQVISMQPFLAEVDEHARLILPIHHFLEAWGDVQSRNNVWSFRQPVIRPIKNSVQVQDILLMALAHLEKPLGHKDYKSYLFSKWEAIYQKAGASVDLDSFMKAVQRKGFIVDEKARSDRPKERLGSFEVAAAALADPDQLSLSSPMDYRFLEGKGSYRPVLQEVGDSLTTIAWDSWIEIHPHTAKELGVKRNDLVTINVPDSGRQVTAAIFPMPGMHRKALVFKRGNGYRCGSRVTEEMGVNPVSLFAQTTDPKTGHPVFVAPQVKITRTGKIYRLATMQKHHDIANRMDIVKKMTVADVVATQTKQMDFTAPDLYPEVPADKDYEWGMSVDLNACTGCSACMVACTTENNIPQVGRDEVLKGREMHWIRMDRYFAGPVDNPELTYQPVMCQHCKHAPCEGVCPVFATVHNPEGFNSQVYNRCVGTRYCANACPYKVRRFNWFTHKWNEIGLKPRDRNPRALNPDVTVRTRGVMEKCTFCYQRVRDAKHQAKNQGRLVRDGEIQTACQQVCPSNAIVFGNIKDSESKVAQLRKSNRSFLMLNGDPEHGHYGIKTLPNVNYLAEVTQEKSAIYKDKHAPKHHDEEHHG